MTMREIYEGGEIDYVVNCSIDTMSMREIYLMITQLEHDRETILYCYLLPIGDLQNGLLSLQTDQDIWRMGELVPSVRIIELYADCRDKEELTEELMKEFMLSPPKSSVMIGEIEDENAQLYDIEFESQELARQGNVQQFSKADTAETSTPVEELHKVLNISDEDYVVDQFSDDDEYCMDDYIVEEEVQIEHEVRNEINTECEPSAATSKRRGKKTR
ncbi:hypothetical protein M9H77_34573 [Catharanthus roseus]|uniref:Uncharacterized protein n=1 Tax=Catharanthus roseus TaxID=4058 RepID=A0ACB9ZM98_CATRO|nr:hypothetical protein M9H77_34573 [Catharanthus roseus]